MRYEYIINNGMIEKQRNVMTNLKKQVQKRKSQSYQQRNRNNQQKFYLLYLDKIVLIQKQYRRYLLRKTKVLEQEVKKYVDYYMMVKQQNRSKEQILNKLKQKRVKFGEQRSKEQVLNLYQKLKKGLNYTLDVAINYSKNVAVQQYLNSKTNQTKEKRYRLQNEVASLVFQTSCHQQRILSWQTKLVQVQEKIQKETALVQALKKSISLSKFNQFSKTDTMNTSTE